MNKWACILICLLLSACASNKTQFDCPNGKGVGCKSITEVNDLVNKGSLDAKTKSKDKATAPIIVPQTQYNTSVERVTEQHLRVWLAPYQDEQGQFHEASVIHTVLRPGYWQMNGAL